MKRRSALLAALLVLPANARSGLGALLRTKSDGNSVHSPAISLPPVGDTNDQHDERVLLYFVKHAIIADAKPS